ncbi:hypothetical protein Tco_0811947 [Tanacetum coccineum]
MDSLEFCSKHNMVAYLENTDGNTEFHQIMDYLICSSIYYALTVSPIVSTLFVEQFWTTAKYRIVNNISYIDATIAGKPVTISEASIRSDLLFDDADGIDSLNNQAIYDNIQLIGNQLKDVPVPLDHFPVPTLIKKRMRVRLQKDHLIPNPYPLLLTQNEDQPQTYTDPSSRLSPSIAIPDSNLEGSGGNHGGQSSNDTSLLGNEDGLTLQSVYDLCVSLCQQVTTQAKEIKALKTRNGYSRKGQKQSQNDKTEHENRKSVKEKSNQIQKSTKVNPTKSKSKAEPISKKC